MERVLSDPGFSDDDGAADPQVAAALAAYADGDAEPLARLLPTARLLVPIVAVAEGVDERGVELDTLDRATDMAVVTLKLTGGQVALPVFSSLAGLAQWHTHARPLPIVGVRAAQAALAEGADLLLLDPGGPFPAPIVGPALRLLASGRAPLPVHADPEVATALRVHLATLPDFAAAALLPAPGGEADAVLALSLRADSVDAAAATAALSAVLAADPVLAERLTRGLDLAILPAGTRLPGDRLY